MCGKIIWLYVLRICRCNFHHFLLNRDPLRFKKMEVTIDRFHKKKGHVNCNMDYDTHWYRDRVPNSSLAEQKNSPLAELTNSFSHMGQVDFLFLLRFKLAGMNLLASMKGTPRVFWLDGAPRPPM